MSVEIHPQLLADCHWLGSLSSGELLLSRNSALHWFILVPPVPAGCELLDLPPARREAVLENCAALAKLLKGQLGYSRVNVAALGNVVPQLHLHVIGRQPDDACWPQPVWGNLPAGDDYSAEGLAQLRLTLQQQLHLKPQSEPQQ